MVRFFNLMCFKLELLISNIYNNIDDTITLLDEILAHIELHVEP